MDFFERCQSGLVSGGLICVKENITKTGVDMDSEDSSVTRYVYTVCRRDSHVKGMGLLIRNLKKNSLEEHVPGFCFVGVA